MIRVFFRRCGQSHAEQHDAAYALLTSAAAAAGADPGTVGTVARTGTGKPFFPDAPALHFSLSHTPGLVVCAIGDRPCGAVGEIPASARFTRFRLPDGVLITVCTAEDTPVADIRELPRDGVSRLP